MKYDAVLFDMDGTVLNTLDDLVNAMNHTLEHFGFPRLSAEQIRPGFGNGAARAVRHCLPEGTSEQLVQEVLDYYKTWYAAHCRIETRPYEGIVPLMERLKAAGVKLAVISNKPDGAVKELAEVFFPGLLTEAVGERPGIPRKPDPAAVLEAARLMEVDLARCVYVGDSDVDIMTARNARTESVGVAWGFRDKEELIAAGAAHLANNMEELEQILLG